MEIFNLLYPVVAILLILIALPGFVILVWLRKNRLLNKKMSVGNKISALTWIGVFILALLFKVSFLNSLTSATVAFLILVFLNAVSRRLSGRGKSASASSGEE